MLQTVSLWSSESLTRIDIRISITFLFIKSLNSLIEMFSILPLSLNNPAVN